MKALACVILCLSLIPLSLAIETTCSPASASEVCSGTVSSGGSGGSAGTASCTVKTYCYSSGKLVGEVSCTSATGQCARGNTYVVCNGVYVRC